MNRVLLGMMSLSLLLPAVLSAQEGYLEVTAPGNRQIQLAIAPPQSLAGPAKAEVAKEIAEVLQFDLNLAGPFAVRAGTISQSSSGIRHGEFDFAVWQAAGAELLIKSGYTLAADSVTVECRLYDVSKQQELVAKRYTGKLADLRRITHTFADEVMLAVTGERGPFAGKIAFVSKATGNKELYLMDYDGYHVQQLTSNGSINLNPDFSPNGRELIYSSFKRGKSDLYRRELFTGTEVRIVSSGGTNGFGAWAPDGKRIAISMSKDGNAEIYLIDKDGRELARLTTNPAIDVSPAWSPDGSRLAFVSDRLGSPQIFIMAADGTGVHRLTTSGSYNAYPRWSPKGDRIAYCRQQEGGFQVHLINPDGSDDQQLTSEGNNEHPHWSPDGRFIVFSSRRDGREALYVMRADGSGQTRISRGKGEDSHPVWSPHW